MAGNEGAYQMQTLPGGAERKAQKGWHALMVTRALPDGHDDQSKAQSGGRGQTQES